MKNNVLNIPEGPLVCKRTLSVVDHTIKPTITEPLELNNENKLMFPICNGAFHKVHEILKYHPDCSVSDHESDSLSESESMHNQNQETASTSSSTTQKESVSSSECSKSTYFSPNCSDPEIYFTTDNSPPSILKDIL